jgi:Holliday junction resolvase RusA-like endonuclease
VVRFTVPFLIPPSVNHYKIPVKIRTREGTRQSFAVTPEGLAFKHAVAIFARGMSVSPGTPQLRKKVRYALYVRVYLGKGQRGDGDNFWKCIADGLQEAGVIHSDARVRDWYISVRDEDRENPRTEIRASVIRGTI